MVCNFAIYSPCTQNVEKVVSTLKEKISAYGGCTKLSREMTALGTKVTPQMVSGWIARDRVPDEKLWIFCEATGFTPEDVRPDIFPSPEVYWSRVRGIVEKRAITNHPWVKAPTTVEEASCVTTEK